MIGNPLLLGGGDYEISRSVRLRSSASAYFNRTPASAGNRRTWTWSGWVKRGAVDASFRNLLVVQSAGNTYTAFGFNSSNNLVFGQDTAGVANSSETTAAVFRDPSAWYHVVLAIDTTQATAANRVRLFINGAQVSTTVSAQIAQNADTFVNSTTTHYIGSNFTPGNFFDGYLTEINFIDGQALTPSSFGESNSITGVWQPKRYTGTYGTNGFYLNFSDNSNNTAATIGKDYSGNGNNWTPNNISVTSGATYDSMLDVPTPWADGGNGRGNYCTLNPLDVSGGTISNANLNYVGANNGIHGTFSFPTGAWYFECTLSAIGSGANVDYGIQPQTNSILSAANSLRYRSTGEKVSGTTASSYGASFTNNDVIGVAFDVTNGILTFYKNNVSQGAAFTGITGDYVPYILHANSVNSSTSIVNFGQRPFSYTPPSGFKALNTLNLPEPTIKKGNLYFDATTYTGNGGTQSIVNSGAFQPDLVWIKARNAAYNNALTDSVRGAQLALYSDLTAAEAGTTFANVSSFNANGFSLGTTSNTNITNGSTVTHVAWQWKEGATQGFDIVTFTGTGAAQNISHSLGVAPRMMIVKPRSGSGSWAVYHASIGAGNAVWLNLTDASASYPTVWNSTAPTSSQFTVGSFTNNGVTFVAYLFAEVAGFSRFGSYTGNGSTDGPFVFCGFRPRWVMMKRTDTAGFSWIIQDTARDVDNPNDLPLYPDLSNAEAASNFIDILSNGFKLRNLGGGWNANGGTYIFAAFAENPFKNALAR